MTITETLRSRWREEWNTVPHLAKARGVFEAALQTIDTLPDLRLELGKSGHLSQHGIDAKFRERTAEKTIPELRRARWELEKTTNDLTRRRGELAPPAPDPMDLVSAAIRRECREFLRNMPIGESLGVAMSDPTFFAAAMEGPAVLSGLTVEQRQRLAEAWTQQNHPEKAAALEDDHAALVLADTAVRAAVETLRRVAGFEHIPSAFNDWMAEASREVEREIERERTPKPVEPPFKAPLPGEPVDKAWIDAIFANGFPDLYPQHSANAA